MGKLKRRAGADDPLRERLVMAEVNRLLAPIAASEGDIESHPPLIEAEALRLAGRSFVTDLREDGSSWVACREALRDWARQQETPVQESYGLEFPCVGNSRVRDLISGQRR